jgi:hypothetical protein
VKFRVDLLNDDIIEAVIGLEINILASAVIPVVLLTFVVWFGIAGHWIYWLLGSIVVSLYLLSQIAARSGGCGAPNAERPYAARWGRAALAEVRVRRRRAAVHRQVNAGG